jgi:hypothetical protein
VETQRLEELRRRIAEKPWLAVGAAALLGALLGFEPPHVRSRSKVGDAVLAAIGAVALRLAREAAFRHLGELAKNWWEESGVRHPDVRRPDEDRVQH